MLLEVDGQRVFAATGGRPFDPQRPAVIFIHGAGLDHVCWQLQSRWFAWHGWSALAVDLPGHGSSGGTPLPSIGAMSDWVVRLMSAAGVARAALVGHSMGAAIALETAARAPERTSHLALLGISSSMPVHPALLAAARDEPDKAYDMMTGWCHSADAKLGGHPAPGLWMTGGSRALLGHSRPGVLASDLAACNAWTSAPDAARQVECPTSFILAAADVMTPPKKGAELAALIAGAKTTLLPQCGHIMMAEAPDAVLDALIAHLGAVS
ncbi:MAG: alpha/beta fold hydrolase [Bacteroidota bacterium]